MAPFVRKIRDDYDPYPHARRDALGQPEMEDLGDHDLYALVSNLRLTSDQRLARMVNFSGGLRAFLEETRPWRERNYRRPDPAAVPLPPLDPVALIDTVRRSGEDFVVVGGVAATLRGSGYPTFDLDLCVPSEPEWVARVLPVLERGIGCSMRRTADGVIVTTSGVVHLHTELAGVGGFEVVRDASETMQVAGGGVRVLSLDGQIAARRASGRDLDLLVGSMLEAIQRLLDDPKLYE